MQNSLTVKQEKDVSNVFTINFKERLFLKTKNILNWIGIILKQNHDMHSWFVHLFLQLLFQNSCFRFEAGGKNYWLFINLPPKQQQLLVLLPFSSIFHEFIENFIVWEKLYWLCKQFYVIFMEWQDSQW